MKSQVARMNRGHDLVGVAGGRSITNRCWGGAEHSMGSSSNPECILFTIAVSQFRSLKALLSLVFLQPAKLQSTSTF